MKNRKFVCILLFTMCMFYLSIPSVVFGESLDDLDLHGYSTTFSDPDVHKFFPDVLRAFSDPDIQIALNSNVINDMARDPRYLRVFYPGVNDSIVALLAIDEKFEDLFRDRTFHAVIQDPAQIGRLITAIEKLDPIPVEDDCEILPREAPKATTLSIVSENGQERQPGARLPLKVEVRDQYGSPFHGADVDFSVTHGGGVVSPTMADTDSDGLARTTFTLGSGPIYQVKARVNETSLIQTFTAVATVPTVPEVKSEPKPSELNLVSGDKQDGIRNTSLVNPFVVKVLDQEEMPLRHVGVVFNVTQGGGSLSDETAITDEDGEARATLTLGRMPGKNKVEAYVARFPSLKIMFTADSSAGPIAQLPSVYWVEEGRLYGFVDGKKKNLVPSVQNATSLAVDMVGRKLYWAIRTVEDKGEIYSVNLGNTVSGGDAMLSDLRGVPLNLAVDTSSNELYWTDTMGRIQRANFTAKDVRKSIRNVQKGLASPRYIALDMLRRKLYWTEDKGQFMEWDISVADVPTGEDGKSKNRKAFQHGSGQLKGIAIAGDKLYWTVEMNGGRREVKYAGVNGSEPKTFAVLGSIPLGLAVDPIANSLYWMTANGGIQRVDLITFENVPTAPANPDAAVPTASGGNSEENSLLANYPNPFNPETWIPYQLSEAADVIVSIYSVNGALVRTLALGHQTAGMYRSRSRAAYWDGRNDFGERVASGLYFYTLTAGDFSATRKMLIRK